LSDDMEDVLIKKANGEEEVFDPSKLEKSLTFAGASKEVRERVVAHVMRELRSGLSTEQIYRHAFEILKREEGAPVAARYSIKRAVFALGPSGFPFEQFLAEILRAHGWTVRTGAALNGHCAPHEVDVLAEKNGRRVGIEAKFHNDASGKTDIKDALYVHARYEDLKKAMEESSRVDEGWLATNTIFTKNAIRYAQCAGLTLLGWDYPNQHGLLKMIEEGGVHPLTCLTTLTEGEKRQLLDNNIVLCKSVQSQLLLQEYGVKPSRVPQVVDEAKRLCGF
jgi:hypothetical protein